MYLLSLPLQIHRTIQSHHLPCLSSWALVRKISCRCPASGRGCTVTFEPWRCMSAGMLHSNSFSSSYIVGLNDEGGQLTTGILTQITQKLVTVSLWSVLWFPVELGPREFLPSVKTCQWCHLQATEESFYCPKEVSCQSCILTHRGPLRWLAPSPACDKQVPTFYSASLDTSQKEVVPDSTGFLLSM